MELYKEGRNEDVRAPLKERWLADNHKVFLAHWGDGCFPGGALERFQNVQEWKTLSLLAKNAP